VNRREFAKTLASFAILATPGLGPAWWRRGPRAAFAGEDPPAPCRIIVFAADGLRDDYARALRAEGAPGLARLGAVATCLAGGQSVTQPGWATIWTGLPSYYTGAYGNNEYVRMPRRMHLMKKIQVLYRGEDLYIGWVTGKGKNICGLKDGPHWQVRKLIQNGLAAGTYAGDLARSNAEVFQLGQEVIGEALGHERFVLFIHFHDPDGTGHMSKDLGEYMAAAREVDAYIAALMDQAAGSGAALVYVSDHGFDFKHAGDVRDAHQFSPRGMLAANVPLPADVLDQCSAARLIYRLAGGDPDQVEYVRDDGKAVEYGMYGAASSLATPT